jgi:hypothetical protein
LARFFFWRSASIGDVYVRLNLNLAIWETSRLRGGWRRLRGGGINRCE